MSDKVLAFAHTFQAAIGQKADGTAMNVGGLPAVAAQVTGITTATITFEGTLTGTWVAVQATSLGDGTVGTTATADGLYLIPTTGLDQLRCRISAWTTGTITIVGKGVLSASGVSLADIDLSGIETLAIDQTTPGTTDGVTAGYKGYTTAASGQIAVGTAGTAVVGTTSAGSLFAIKAHPDNTDAMWIGNVSSDVTNANGFPLEPGETIVLNMANLNQVYFDADVSGEKVCWIKLA